MNSVTTQYPLHYATNVYIDAVIELTFEQEIQDAFLSNTYFKIFLLPGYTGNIPLQVEKDSTDPGKITETLYKTLEKLAKMWMQRNLLKTAVEHGKSPQMIRNMIDRAVRQGRIRDMLPTDEQEQIIMEKQRKLYPDGIDLHKLEQDLFAEIQSLQKQLTVKTQ